MIQKTKIFVEINLREKKIPRQHAPTVEFKRNYVDKLQVRYFLNPCTTFNVENQKTVYGLKNTFASQKSNKVLKIKLQQIILQVHSKT